MMQEVSENFEVNVMNAQCVLVGIIFSLLMDYGDFKDIS